MCPRLSAQLVSSFEFISPSLPCFGFLWYSTQQLPLVHSHGMWSLCGISAGCKRGLCPVSRAWTGHGFTHLM